MLATIRDRKDQGSAAIYVRARDAIGRYWNFSTKVWDVTETAAAKVFLVEYPDSDPYESRYQTTITQPPGEGVVEYVRAADGVVLGYEDFDPALTSSGSPSSPAASGDGMKLLSARILSHVADANNYEYVETAEFTQGDSGYLYFQLVDAGVDIHFNPPYRRYIPASGAIVSVKLRSVNDAKTLDRAAALACAADDRSIWKVQISASDAIVGTRDMAITLTEAGKVTRGVVKQAVTIHSQDGSI